MHPQAQLLIADALVSYAGGGDLEPRERRAWDLAASLLAEEELSMDALATQVDHDWTEPGR